MEQIPPDVKDFYSVLSETANVLHHRLHLGGFVLLASICFLSSHALGGCGLITEFHPLNPFDVIEPLSQVKSALQTTQSMGFESLMGGHDSDDGQTCHLCNQDRPVETPQQLMIQVAERVAARYADFRMEFYPSDLIQFLSATEVRYGTGASELLDRPPIGC